MAEKLTDDPRLRVTVSGSFRRNPPALRAEWQELQATGCRILSPASIDFVHDHDGFVMAEHELGDDPEVIEQRHLAAMVEADFVWLYCPEGYVGLSASMELGFAHALGLRVFARETPSDLTLSKLVTVVSSPVEAAAAAQDVGDAPARGLAALQRYYRRAAWQRGWDGEDAEECVELLAGEVDELREAVADDDREAAGLEAADVQLYAVHLANVMGWDLGDQVTTKERINASRFPRVPGR